MIFLKLLYFAIMHALESFDALNLFCSQLINFLIFRFEVPLYLLDVLLLQIDCFVLLCELISEILDFAGKFRFFAQ